jgi:pSer/pThr/pTyr-binding forkhead associated (FHA) protein
MSNNVNTGILPERDPEGQRALAKQSRRKLGTGTLGGKSEILLLIDNDVKRFPLAHEARWLLGRFDTTDHPDQVDLSSYLALEKGVSRFHVQLQVEGDQLFATDLSSTNGTYVSGEPLTPRQPTLIRNGDELLLGRLLIQVLFR